MHLMFCTFVGMLKDIREVDDTEITVFVQAHGEKPFRARQIMEWLWKKGVTDFNMMRNLPARLRESLKEHFTTVRLAHQDRTDQQG